jgi:catechol 2,3-dioxygenase-like lactoylglutathione lyase family enzyme
MTDRIPDDDGFRVVAVDHVQLAMPAGAEAAAVAFYRDVLGFVQEAKPEPLASRGGCWFRQGPVALHLGVEDGFRPARKAHPALVVDGLDRLAGRLAEAGHPLRWDDELPGVRRGNVEDPFGNRLELIAADPPRPAGR